MQLLQLISFILRRMNLAGIENRGDTDGDTDGSEFGAAISQGVLPELYVGLAYSGTTGRLSVEIIKGSHFKSVKGSEKGLAFKNSVYAVMITS